MCQSRYETCPCLPLTTDNGELTIDNTALPTPNHPFTTTPVSLWQNASVGPAHTHPRRSVKNRSMTLPNSIAMSRIACIPLLIWILSPVSPWQGHGATGLRGGEQEIIASIVFILASITDGLDGYLARRRHQITTMGMLLDPLADKLLITTGYIILVGYNPSIVKPWIAVIVIGREFLVSGLRSIAATEGFTIEASDLGKFKMLVQIVSVVAVIL